MNKYNSRIIIACDVDNKKELYKFLDKMGNEKLFLKLGMQIIYKEGFDFIKELKQKGHNIFIDLKVHDIPNTAKNAVKSILEHKPDFITIHTLGGSKMMKAIIDTSKKYDSKILGVTILTSMNQNDINEINITKNIKKSVYDLMVLAKKSGLTHIVCSPFEAKQAREIGLISITPGIRFASDSNNDQSRFVTPDKAFEMGSDFIVMGRSLLLSENPLEKYKSIKEASWRK